MKKADFKRGRAIGGKIYANATVWVEAYWRGDIHVKKHLRAVQLGKRGKPRSYMTMAEIRSGLGRSRSKDTSYTRGIGFDGLRKNKRAA